MSFLHRLHAPRWTSAMVCAEPALPTRSIFHPLLCQTLAEAVDTLKAVLAADTFYNPSTESLRSASASLRRLTCSATATTAAPSRRQPTNAIGAKASSSGTLCVRVAIFE